jgi:uncharacterized membrane protein
MVMKNFARYFLRGSLVLVPLAATIYIVFLILRTIDQILPGIPVPGLGLVLTIGLITLVGFLTSNVLGRTAFDAIEKALTRMPFIKLVYSSIRDLIGAFVGDKKSFDKPVMVSLSPGSGTKVLGFTTRDRLEMLGLQDHVAVYLPQSYNFAGNLIVVPRVQVEPLDVEIAELMTFVVSGGVSGFGVGTSLPPLSMRSPPRGTPS